MNRPSLGCEPHAIGSKTTRRVGMLVGALISLATVAFTTLAHAESSSAGGDASSAPGLPDPSQWMIYAGPEIAIYALTGKGNSSGSAITGPRVSPTCPQCGDLGPTISKQERSRELIASFLAGGTFGALTPALDLPGRPRAFVELNISSPQTIETSLARRGNPGKVEFPSEGRSSRPVGEGAMAGEGTQMSVQQQGPQIHAGLGFSLEFPILDAQVIRIKPSVIYTRTITDIEGTLVRPIRLNDDQGDDQQLDDFRVINLGATQRKVHHASGPSLELEYFPNITVGPIILSVFGRAHASYSWTSPKSILKSCNTAGGQPDECMTWKYTQDRWAYRATLGVHLNWMPRRFW